MDFAPSASLRNPLAPQIYWSCFRHLDRAASLAAEARVVAQAPAAFRFDRPREVAWLVEVDLNVLQEMPPAVPEAISQRLPTFISN